MKDYLAIVLLIAPGFVCRNLFERLNNGGKWDGDRLEYITSALLYGILIYTLNYLLLKNFFVIRTISDLRILFNRLDFIAIFIGVTVISTLLVAITLNVTYNKFYLGLINLFRHWCGKEPTTLNQTVWGTLFQGKGPDHALVIYKNGHLIGKGFLKYQSWEVNEHKELCLENGYLIDDYPELFDTVQYLYFDLDNDLIVKEYDPKKFNDYLKAQDHPQLPRM